MNYALCIILSLTADWLSPIRASCRIRTNDPEITNHVLWPTELKRRVGKLLISRRYNLLPLLRSRPGGLRGSWPYETYPCFQISRFTQSFLMAICPTFCVLRRKGKKKMRNKKIKLQKNTCFGYFYYLCKKLKKENHD